MDSNSCSKDDGLRRRSLQHANGAMEAGLPGTLNTTKWKGTKIRVLRNKIVIASLCPHIIVAADKQFDIKSETLLHSSSAWNGVPYEAYSKGAVELSVLRITIPPHSKLKWHTHPMPNAAYIVSGQITIEQKGVPNKRRFLAGEVVPETVNTLHRGITGERPVVLIVFYAGVKGMPLAESNP